MKKLILTFCFAAVFGCDATHDEGNDFQRMDFGPFTMVVPSTWQYAAMDGVDSFVGIISTKGFENFGFDYGMYSNHLNVDDAKHNISYSIIGGRGAKIVRPKVSGQGFTGVYFENIKGEMPSSIRFTMSGLNVQAETEQALVSAFKTLRFK